MHDLLSTASTRSQMTTSRGQAAGLDLDVSRYERDRVSPEVLAQVERDRTSGEASDEVQGRRHCSSTASWTAAYEVSTLLEALAR